MSDAPRGRGRPPVAEKIVAALEAAGMRDAADLARAAGGLPPRVLSPDELFMRDVAQQAVHGAQPVAFVASDEDEARHWVALIKDAGRGAFVVTRQGSRVEVRRG